MTDWLEELLEQAAAEENGETGLELPGRSLLWGLADGVVRWDDRQDGPVRTTGQGDALTGERIGGAVPESESAVPGRNAPEWELSAAGTFLEEDIRGLNGRLLRGEAGQPEVGRIAGSWAEKGMTAPLLSREAAEVRRNNSVEGTVDEMERWLPWDTGAAELYRRLARTGREGSFSRLAERTVTTEHQSVGTPGVTVDQLDRAVRRDSRRYDGGMELY